MLGRSYGIEKEVEEFETDNKVFYPTVEDAFEHEHKGDNKVYLGKRRNTEPESIRDQNEEEPAPLHDPTPPEWYMGIL
jgi:hypothetical protein